ncbi:unnamed protein product [Calypogeia fissa]
MEPKFDKVEESRVRTPMGSTKADEQRAETQTTQALPSHMLGTVPNPKVKKEVTFSKTPEVIPRRVRAKTATSGATNSHSKKKGEPSRLGVSRSVKSWGSKKENPKHHDQKKLLTQHATGKEQTRQRIGGEVLQELLIMNEENSPFKDKVQMGATFRETCALSRSPFLKSTVDSLKNSEHKAGAGAGAGLNRPVAFSTANLMQKLQDIEQEAFDLDAALQVAKKKGIVLSKYDREEIKAALAEEEERKTGSSLKCGGNELEGRRKPSARYIPLLKIPDPRISHHGPFIAPRKVKKQPDFKGDDMRTIQPALLDLWDLEERCPQVCSANLKQPNTFSVTSWTRALGNFYETNKNSVWVQREDVCRAAASAQAVYDNCLYRPSLEPQCHCYREQPNSHIHFK